MAELVMMINGVRVADWQLIGTCGWTGATSTIMFKVTPVYP